MGLSKLFSRTPQAQPERVAQSDYLKNAPNTPYSLYDDAAGKFAEIWGSSKVNEARFFMIALAAVVLALACVGTVASVMPLKEIRPWFVEVNPITGVVNKPVEIQRVDPNLAVVKAELARWAEAVYAIDPIRSRDSLRWANLRTAEKAVGQFAEFRTRERIFERIQREPDLVREVRVTAVDVSQRGTAFIFLQTAERVGPTSPTPDKVKRFRVTLNYSLVPAKQELDLLSNPLGLFVTFFADTEERAP
ncbi:type IV secretion system protein [Caenimonas sedimenti]|uniref:Type IV secretion system protein n=1 Tax=Caenimonas sedimenti TaxID=2596921 RepID=A0A562ZSX6_9BURK|nr:type IV secretion system protein [Caenimonas sedimenti]TWO71438.1 type IV secretion system protein [Caenimonas sedimenti]